MKKITTKILGTLLFLGLATSAQATEINLNACAGCHGRTFEKSAMGKSLIVKEMNATAISEALIGYKNGTYGHSPMKGIMKGQVAKYSIDDLNATGKRIKNLK